MLKSAKSVASLGRASLSRARLVAAVSTLLAPRSTSSRLVIASPRATSLHRILPIQLRSYGNVASSRVVEEPAKIVSYDEVKAAVEKNDPNVVLVDVREPSEYDEGHIGNAINIPFKTMPGALGLDANEFEQTLGFEKPSSDKTLLFYCLGGVRSTSSEQLASTYGYKHRMNYLGSYQDWTNNSEKK